MQAHRLKALHANYAPTAAVPKVLGLRTPLAVKYFFADPWRPGQDCPISSSLGGFPSYWNWLWCPGLSPVLVSIALSLRFPYLVFSIRSSLPLDFNRVSSLRPTYRHPFGRPFTYSLFR